MKKDLLHTPEGVRDIYSTECAEKKVIENRLHDVCASYGYNDIQTSISIITDNIFPYFLNTILESFCSI